MRVKFWGTRGSLPKSGPDAIRYGGNTSCVEARSERGTFVMIDCGSGAQALGQALLQENPKITKGAILITHTHWDHIQGFPFFAPLFIPGMEWDIYGPKGFATSLKEKFAQQMEYSFFPVSMDKLGATIRFHDLIEGDFEIDDIVVRTQYLNHATLTLAYRLEADGASLVYSCDHELHNEDLSCGCGNIRGGDLDHAAFMADADLIIHDAQYTPEEYEGKIGWGHSTASYAAHIARFSGAGTLALTHHDPMHSDDDIDAILERTKREVLKPSDKLNIFAAGDGGHFELPKRLSRGDKRKVVGNATVAPKFSADRRAVFSLLGDASLEKLVEAAVAPDGISWRNFDTPGGLCDALEDFDPSVIILNDDLETINVSVVLEHLREHHKPHIRNVEVIVLGSGARKENSHAGERGWMKVPTSDEYLRTRIRQGMLRFAYQPEQSDKVMPIQRAREMLTYLRKASSAN